MRFDPTDLRVKGRASRMGRPHKWTGNRSGLRSAMREIQARLS
jgi:hypothetical protein